MSIRAAATDKAIGAAGALLGTGITVQSLTQAVSLAGAVLGLILTALSIWLVVRRLQVSRLERERLRHERDMKSPPGTD